jgi:hypothetical protein
VHKSQNVKRISDAEGQLGLERHGARALPGLCARIDARLLALSAALWHNREIGQPSRHLSAYAR